MSTKRRTSYRLVSLAGAFAILACAIGGAKVVPTATFPAPIATKEIAPTTPPVRQATETPSVAAGDITLDTVNGFKDSFDTWHVVGLVTNATDHAVSDVGLEVEIFDANDNSLYTDSTNTDLYTLAPGETSTFSLAIYEDLPDADNFVATITGSDSTEVDRAAVEVQHTTMTVDDDGDVHVTGELANNTGGPVSINTVAAAVFTSGGELITADPHTVAIGYLEDGESGPFRVTMSGPASGLDDLGDFRVYVDAETADPADPFSIEFTDHYEYLDTFGNLHIVGELTNNSDQNLNIRLVAAVYDPDDNVIDAASLDTTFSSIKPGESIPYDFNSWGPINYTDGLYYSDKADRFTVQWDPYWTWTTDTELIDLTTSDDDNTFDDTQGTFTGKIVNNSGEKMGSAVIIIFFRDKETGQVIGMGYTQMYDELADGASADYTVYVPTVEGFDVTTAEFFIVVKGQRP